MAKQLTPSEIAAQLREMGMPVPEELEIKAANEKTDAIESMFYAKLSSVSNEGKRVAAAAEFRKHAEEFAKALMTLDASESGKPGRGEKKFDLRSFTVETSNGELIVKLYNEK